MHHRGGNLNKLATALHAVLLAGDVEADGIPWGDDASVHWGNDAPSPDQVPPTKLADTNGGDIADSVVGNDAIMGTSGPATSHGGVNWGAALVSLEELVLVPTAVVRDADCQTEMVSVAVPTPINTDLSAAERAGALVNIVDEVQRHLVQVQGFMATSSNIQSDWVHVRKKLAVAVDGVKLSMESWKRMT